MCVCVCKSVSRLVSGRRREPSLFEVDTSLTTLEPAPALWGLPTLIDDPRPLDSDPAGSITHAHRHKHLSPTSLEQSPRRRCRPLCGLGAFGPLGQTFSFGLAPFSRSCRAVLTQPAKPFVTGNGAWELTQAVDFQSVGR